MAQSSAKAASPPPSRPASPNLPSTDQRNDEVTGDESAPLLSNQEPPPGAGVVSAKAIRILTSSALSSAVCCLLFLIVIAILMSALPYGYHVPWQTSGAFGGVVTPVHSCNFLVPLLSLFI